MSIITAVTTAKAANPSERVPLLNAAMINKTKRQRSWSPYMCRAFRANTDELVAIKLRVLFNIMLLGEHGGFAAGKSPYTGGNMQIDILSSNTLKLTLSRLDMFDLDIKYESLSGKNPETKRLLAHVLKSIRLDNLNNKTGFDFSCDRIFVEAFPRPDGGCMLYVSNLGDDTDLTEENGKKRRNASTTFRAVTTPKAVATSKAAAIPKAVAIKRENLKTLLIIELGGVRELGGVCRSLCLQKAWGRQGFEGFESALYISEDGQRTYRLIIKGEVSKQTLFSGIAKEFGEVLRGERELMYTKEHFKAVIEESAAERLSELL